MGQQWPAAGSGALSEAVRPQDLLKEVAIIFITSTIVWPQVKQQGGNTSLSITNSQSSLRLAFIESVMPSLLFTWGQTMVEVMKIMVTSLKRSHACTSTLSDSNPAAGHHQPTSLVETPGYSQASLGQSLVGSLLLSPGP